MKKYLVVVFILLMPKMSFSADLCFKMLCSDCTDYTPQYLRVVDFISSNTFSGYVQASDSSFGVPAYIVIKGDSLLFSRVAGSGKKTYFYDADLTTWNGTSVTGTRHAAKYSYTNNVPYEVLADRELTLKFMLLCPLLADPPLDAQL